MNGAGPGWEGGAEWLRAEGEASDVVMSSRVRLARNLAGYPFMTRATGEDRVQILDLCRRRILSDEFKRASSVDSVMWVDLHEVDKLECQVLVERHLISRQHARGKLSTGKGGVSCARAVAIGLPGERVAVMVNEEDQLRIQVIRSGLALTQLLEQVDRIDDALEQGLDYAFHPRFGYLTACPTNIGTGIRCSVMLRLLHAEQPRAAQHAQGPVGLVVDHRPTLLEQRPPGVALVVDDPRHDLSFELVHKHVLALAQRGLVGDLVQIARGVGALAVELLSHARLGVLLGLVEGVEQQRINDLMLQVQQAHLQCAVSRELTQQQRRLERANMVRSRLGGE